ncbi:hypothetical protein M879_26265 [Mycobacteroides abscessus V06705]|nr:hypothetical protein M879_26265 [Mycobacteroides abscessus V06705]
MYMQCPMTMDLFSNGDYFISQVLPYVGHAEPIKHA